MPDANAPSAQQDIWRDSLVRYLGYSNELGESFRPIVPQLVVPSYLVAFGYVLGDTYDKASKAHTAATSQGASEQKRTALAANAAVDTLLWQSLASVAIPGFTINRLVALSSAVAEKTLKQSPVLRRWAPTALGLGVIPLIIHPIDTLVDNVMDRTTRQWSADWIRGFD
ncbi:hypothetical protein P43SY_008847 [Pythium insidiosum]|uniref:Mitochondrial fission process protein 1 n=1 Tax=Pythium insidiosum TaxID=114742 RepID=A0AAD5M8Q9_PYTIN|nr:hypothetical protein P43SY_008847 [Pythium insidiosum]